MPQYPSALLRFQLPLIKPELRISRIRLSDKDSWVRPRKVALTQAESDESELILQVDVYCYDLRAK